MTKENVIKHLEGELSRFQNNVSETEQLIKMISSIKFFPIGIRKGTTELYHLNLYLDQDVYSGPMRVSIKAVCLEYHSMDRMPYSKVLSIKVEDLYTEFIPYTQKTNAIVGE
jgi:hypothetical protein